MSEIGEVNGVKIMLSKEQYNKYKETLNEQLESSKKEIKRLNNIIDKLSIEIECGTGRYTYDTDYNRGLSDAFNYMNDKLKELTEENNE